VLKGVILVSEQKLILDDMSETIIETAKSIAIRDGAEKVTVRSILQALGTTNRVFYNRFHNIDEVLNIVYERMILKIRESISDGFDPEGDFFSQVMDIVAGTLIMSYDVKMNFNNFVFKNDSVSHRNFEWWKAEITKLIEIGKSCGALGDIDTEIMSYSIWCFIRGYNADALGRGIPKEEAVRNFRYSFGILLDGMKKQ
jgi:AcrR family transcriptional regulator